ncbi:MAG: hypothetical protein RIS17_1350 [Pseudomonadota bacterium]|jgi:hypothetical protein
MDNRILAFGVASLLAAVPAFGAEVVPGLYNTGVGVGGVALAPGDGQRDANYVITASSHAGAVIGDQAYTYKNGLYAAENPGSRWISYARSGGGNAGTVEFSTTFNLAGYNAATASLSGLMGADNELEILLNGVSTGIGLTGTVISNFSQLYNFTISSGFTSGVNTLTLRVNDTGSPLGVRLDGLQLTADRLGVVPEPASWAMLIAGFGLVGAVARRRRVTVSA